MLCCLRPQAAHVSARCMGVPSRGAGSLVFAFLQALVAAASEQRSSALCKKAARGLFSLRGPTGFRLYKEPLWLLPAARLRSDPLGGSGVAAGSFGLCLGIGETKFSLRWTKANGRARGFGQQPRESLVAAVCFVPLRTDSAWTCGEEFRSLRRSAASRHRGRHRSKARGGARWRLCWRENSQRLFPLSAVGASVCRACLPAACALGADLLGERRESLRRKGRPVDWRCVLGGLASLLLCSHARLELSPSSESASIAKLPAEEGV